MNESKFISVPPGGIQPHLEERTHNPIFQVLRLPKFQLIWISQVISQITVNVLLFVLGVYLYKSTHTNSSVSFLYVMFGVPAVLFGIFSGTIIDRFEKKKLLIITSIIRAALVGFLIFQLNNAISVYLLSFAISIVSQFFIPGQGALIGKVVPKHLFFTANSLFTLTFYLAILGGFVAAGPLLRLFGTQQVLILCSLAFIVSGLMISLLKGAHDTSKKNVLSIDAIRNDITQIYLFIKKSFLIFAALLMMVLGQVILGIFATLGPGFADKVLAIDLVDASVVILGPAACGMILGALFISGVPAVSKRKLVISGITASGLLFIFISIIGKANATNVTILPLKTFILLSALVAFFLLGIANSLIDVTCNAILQQNTPESMRGRMYGLLSSIINGFAIVPVVISGVVADLVGVEKIILFIGIVLLILSIVPYTIKRRLN